MSILSNPAHALRTVLRDPQLLPELTLAEWDLVLRQARAAGLAGRLSYLIEQHGGRAAVPPQVLRHLDGERLVADTLARDVERELNRVIEPLVRAAIPVIVLKGAAYIVGRLPVARGRAFADIDILVPPGDIDGAEHLLVAAGWRGVQKPAWDQRFYREWMHQIPPMVHTERGSVVDLHFAIVPNRGHRPVSSDLLFRNARPAPGQPRIGILAPGDMVLHSATHLFDEGEFAKALRDLFDLDGLLRHFSQTSGFWAELLERADELALTRPLYYALRYTGTQLGTPIPPAVADAAGRFAPFAGSLMDSVFDRALRPRHPTADDRVTNLCLLGLYARGHWLRLPVHLLVPHLLRSLWIQRRAALRGTEPDR
jgi:hypothetical protein